MIDKKMICQSQTYMAFCQNNLDYCVTEVNVYTRLKEES